MDVWQHNCTLKGPAIFMDMAIAGSQFMHGEASEVTEGKIIAQGFGEEQLTQKTSRRSISSAGMVWSKTFVLQDSGAAFVLKSSGLSHQQIGILSM